MPNQTLSKHRNTSFLTCSKENNSLRFIHSEKDTFMKNYIVTAVVSIVVISLGVLGFVLGGISLSDNQIETLKILLIICGASALYCFVVGEIAHNNSQMDKLWSILPIAYVWVIAVRGGMSFRLIVIAILVTLWGIRLTFNFARKGAYQLKFWAGEEDYRWSILRQKPFLSTRFGWALFDLLFICIYQNAIVLGMTLPALAVMDSQAAFGVWDIVATALMALALIIETIADEEQWIFQETKKKLLKEGHKLEDLEYPYRRGFNTVGLWSRSRHPNYLGEQAIWLFLYIFTIGASVTTYYVFNWSLFGSMLIILLFLGSSAFGEGVSAKKYKEYAYYRAYVSKYIPLRKYDYEKAKAKVGE